MTVSKLADTQVVVSLGTNSDREQNLLQTLELLNQQFGELALSPVYQSGSVSEVSKADYLNMIVAFHSSDTVSSIKSHLSMIENQCGRDRQSNDVAMDIDLLFYGERTGLIGGVELPRAELLSCAYMLRPLADLLPEYEHPQENECFLELWRLFAGDNNLTPVDFVWRDQLVSVAPTCLQM